MSRITQWIVADAGLNDVGPLRYVLGATRHTSRRSLVRYIFFAIAFIGISILLTLSDGITDRSASAVVYDALYMPTTLLQAVISAAVFGSTIHFIHTVRNKKAWDSLRATAGGSGAAIRAAWAGIVYYRLSGPLGAVVYAPRLVLLGFLLSDLTAFRGDYLTLIAGGHQPTITPPLEILLLGAFVAAAFLLPLSTIGLEAAVGLLFSTFTRSRTTATFIQIVLTLARVCWSLAAVFLFTSLTSVIVNGQSVPDIRTIVAVLANGAAGDWGLGMMHTATVDTIWTNVPYSAYIGIVLLGVVLLQSGLTALILRWAARRAQQMD